MDGDSASAVMSIRDVARAAGVSPATVSRVLNGRASSIAISPATVDRVRAAATALRYRPNASARSLRTTKTQTIGVIMQDLLHPFAAEFLRVIYSVCQARGYHVLVGHADQGAHENVALGDILSPDRVDGLLLIGDLLQHTEDEAEMRAVLAMHRYVVSVGCRPSAAVGLSITVDNDAGVELGLAHLVSLGHRSIAYIAGSCPHGRRESWESERRRAAYHRYIAAHGLPWTAEHNVVVTDDFTAAQEALRGLATAPTRPTAAFVVNDWTAIVALKAALTCGIRIPDQLSLIGFDGIAFSALCTPGLTTIQQPLDAMGHHAATALLDSIEGTPPSHALTTAEQGGSAVVFTPALIRRESCAPLSASVRTVTSGGPTVAAV